MLQSVEPSSHILRSGVQIPPGANFTIPLEGIGGQGLNPPWCKNATLLLLLFTIPLEVRV